MCRGYFFTCRGPTNVGAKQSPQINMIFFDTSLFFYGIACCDAQPASSERIFIVPFMATNNIFQSADALL